ncbi:hypothetical protein ACFYZT_16995 [Streptomyces sp. NPDC001591]|uniref:hypothetical protein n=1 Tax=unclassified Streptomyces TaxID=2593676 RepID=UPI0033F50505
MNALYVVAAVVVAAGWTVSTLTLRMRALQVRADRLERRLGLVLDHLGIEEPEPAGLEAVRALAREGRTVAAIKNYREITGAGLAEAKQAVESLDLAPRSR